MHKDNKHELLDVLQVETHQLQKGIHQTQQNLKEVDINLASQANYIGEITIDSEILKEKFSSFQQRAQELTQRLNKLKKVSHHS